MKSCKRNYRRKANRPEDLYDQEQKARYLAGLFYIALNQVEHMMNKHIQKVALEANYDFLLISIDEGFNPQVHPKNDDGMYLREFIWGFQMEPHPVIINIVHGENTMDWIKLIIPENEKEYLRRKLKYNLKQIQLVKQYLKDWDAFEVI